MVERVIAHLITTNGNHRSHIPLPLSEDITNDNLLLLQAYKSIAYEPETFSGRNKG